MSEQPELEPTMVQVVLAELKKIPASVLKDVEDPLNFVDLMQLSICRTLQVVEKHMDLTYCEEDLLPAPDSDDQGIQLIKVAYTEQVENLSQQYWDQVGN